MAVRREVWSVIDSCKNKGLVSDGCKKSGR